MSSRLTPLRQIEALRLLTAVDQFDADHFIELMAEVILGTPNVVHTAALRLEAWNIQSPEHPRFIMHDVEDGYNTIAEVVLDAAAIYRGETSEEPAPYEPRAATQADFDVWRRVLSTLRGNRDCFQRAAGGQVSRGAWEAQAAACSRALVELEQLLSNAGMADSDTEV